MSFLTIYVKALEEEGKKIEVGYGDSVEAVKEKVAEALQIKKEDFEFPYGVEELEQDMEVELKVSESLLAKIKLEELGIKVNENSLFKYSETGDLNVVELLLRAKVDVNYKEGKLTPLYWASRFGHLEVVKLLVEHGADVNCKDKWKETPLHHASINGHLEVVKFLVENGADVNCKDNRGWTSLHFASRDGHLEVVKFLVEHGADLNCKPKWGQIPLHLASFYGRSEIVEYLKSINISRPDLDDTSFTDIITILKIN